MYTAVIIEPRIHPALELVLSNFHRNLNEQWEFLVFHGNTNTEYIQSIIRNNRIYRNIRLILLNVDNLSMNDYNWLFYSDFFYSHIHSEHFLVFQTDTLISEKYKNNIYDFLEYDYVGAPWKSIQKVGNGGLSLRRKSKMIEMIRHGGYIKENGEPHYEDRFFSNTCGTNIIVSLYVPSIELAKKFSVETIFSDESFGIHKPWGHLNTDEMKLLKSNFPELDLLEKYCS